MKSASAARADVTPVLEPTAMLLVGVAGMGLPARNLVRKFLYAGSPRG